MGKLGNFAGKGLYGVKIAKADGQEHDLPSPHELVPPESDDVEYCLEDMDFSVTFSVQLSPEEFERLEWVLATHWLWRRYRRTLN